MTSFLYARLLDHLEALEDPLLCWGVVDGGFSDAELRKYISEELMRSGSLDEIDDVIETMTEQALLVQDLTVSPARWRTRNGETMRLLARLRQIMLGGSWQTGVNLVSDFRYARRPRAYPVRDQAWDAVLDGVVGVSDTHRSVIDAMTAIDTDHFRLSGFQVRATRQTLAALSTSVTSAIVVGAGTGSGKTLAFYLPAFAYLAGLKDSTRWTRALAVYPRTELLKDQLDTAFANARRLDPLWMEASGRPMTIGALYASTPQSLSWMNGPYNSWPKRATGWASPQLRCPGDGYVRCGGELVWPFDDVKQKKERLVCGTCKSAFDDSVVVLTRERMRTHPPDVLFVTTEMLNRGLSELQLRQTFGVGVAKKPRLMLLDEIHTYDGTTGAQAAMVLRRWHHSLQGPVTFVGLSATLSNPIRHMADLTGVEDELVASITPEPAEMEYEGAEYLIALRSDPTSGASVLSTTIQASMLLPRTQDAPNSRISGGLLGTKAFVFTDDLDVTNRLYGYLLDAEGQRYYSGRTEHTKKPLASTRVPSDDPLNQRRAGQVWDLPNAIGHKFADRGSGLNIGRTTSQDSGVDTNAQLIVATASLEVGYDDPDVGVVIQHKAPRGVAAFLQRKGRAGRQRGMRPYTAVVLSDYGRDRATYEAWDTLFDPVLPDLVLPIRNRAVLRMQATIAMIDWLAGQLSTQNVMPTTKAWSALAKPPAQSFAKPGRETQTKAVAILRSLMRDPARQRSLREWVQGALQLTDSEANEILWHPPRPLLLAAIPTLARRLHNEWSIATQTEIVKYRDTMGENPLPDFFPMNLFSELALPETYVSIPPQTRRDTEDKLEPMRMGQMLREYAPGRVSRRFATRNLDHRHWIPVPLGNRDAVIDLAPTLLAFQREEACTIEVNGTATKVSVVRPDQVKLELPPDDVKDSSNATMVWRSQFLENGDGLVLRVPTADPIGRYLSEARFFLHAQNSHLAVHRVATQSDATVMVKGGPGQTDVEMQVRSRFTLDGEQVCLGATYDVDGLRMTLQLPKTITPPDHVMPGLRSAWFRHVLTTDPLLLDRVNSFQVGWFHEALECMLLMTAVTNQSSVSDAYQAVKGSLDKHLDDTLDALFRSPGVGESDSVAVSRMGRRLKSELKDPAVVTRLDVLTEQLWAPDPGRFQAWLRERTLSTIGLAAIAAARQICPEHDPDGVVLDVEPGFDADDGPRTGQVWLSEASVGGGGFIEALAARVRPDPRRFLRLIMRAVQPSTHELVDTHMQRLVHLITTDDDWRALVNDFRSAPTQAARVAGLANIRDALRKSGIYGAEQSVVSCLANRVLRPGSSDATDDALKALIDTWSGEEARIGVEIPPRTWAYLMRKRSDLDAGLVLGSGATERQRMDAIQSVLWPRGWTLRAEELQAWNPFADNLPAAPDLLRAVAAGKDSALDVNQEDAASTVRSVLAKNGSAQVIAAPEAAGVLADLLVDLSTEPVTTDYLHVYPRVIELEHNADGSVVVSLELAEVSA
ncbi:protein DpdJ [Nocardioides sp. CPCC 206347]|uniref:protein DpdJ n=1 Tax=unclassified Nocardioides TaxID=2615069 RepID=UPI00360752D0